MKGVIKKVFVCIVLYVFSIFSQFSYAQTCAKKWTWNYKKVFSEKEMKENSVRAYIEFSQNTKERFSQLIFSWNALRPNDGYFSFYVKTRNCKNKKWGKWHKMIDWGAHVQKSYFSKDNDATYLYVRLETGLITLADAFKVKVESHGVAKNLGLLKSVCVCASDFTKFKPERVSTYISDAPFSQTFYKSVWIKKMPKISQRKLNHPDTAKICSPTSCSMLASYFNRKKIDAAAFANKVFDYGLRAYGSWPFNVAELYGECAGGVLFYTQRMNSFADLYKKLVKKIPVVVSVRGRLLGAPKSYNGGHFMVVIGWDAKKGVVICHDPAFYTDKSTFITYPLGTFLKGWEKSRRLTYTADFLNYKGGI